MTKRIRKELRSVREGGRDGRSKERSKGKKRGERNELKRGMIESEVSVLVGRCGRQTVSTGIGRNRDIRI